MKQHQFHAQNVPFITPTNAEHINEQFNSSVGSMGHDETHPQVNVMFVSHFYPLPVTTSAATTQHIYSGRATSRKFIVSICVRTQVSILLSSKSYPVLMEGITSVKFNGQYVNFIVHTNYASCKCMVQLCANNKHFHLAQKRWHPVVPLQIWWKHFRSSRFFFTFIVIVTNKEVYARVKKPTIIETIRLNRLRWFGHVQRMEENRIPKTVLYTNLGTTKLSGRPRTDGKMRWERMDK